MFTCFCYPFAITAYFQKTDRNYAEWNSVEYFESTAYEVPYEHCTWTDKPNLLVRLTGKWCKAPGHVLFFYGNDELWEVCYEDERLLV